MLTHNEMGELLNISRMRTRKLSVYSASDSGEGAILPTWTAVDVNNVRTSRELWTQMKNQGWNVDVSLNPVQPHA